MGVKLSGSMPSDFDFGVEDPLAETVRKMHAEGMSVSFGGEGAE